MLCQHCIDKITFGWMMDKWKDRRDFSFLMIFGWIGGKMKKLKYFFVWLRKKNDIIENINYINLLFLYTIEFYSKLI